MQMKYYKNKKYNVLTDKGYKHFDGLRVVTSKNIMLITTNVGHIYATLDHEFYYTVDKKKPIKDFKKGDVFYSDFNLPVYIKDLNELDYEMKVYDLVEVEDGNAFLITDEGIKVSNCCYIDEMAFIENDVEFYTSTYPVITSGKKTKVIITSTPNGMNLFYKIWTESINGDNDYKNYKVLWREHPDRDEAWATEQERQLGTAKFNVEFNSISYETELCILINDTEVQMSIGDLYEDL